MFVDSQILEAQLALAAAIFFGTFVYEDGATVLAATLTAGGRLDPGLGLVAAFLGIWVGDIGLYALGSTFSRFAARSRRFARLLEPEALAKAETWFEKRGSMALVMSRAIPGSRLPLYLASGALRLPLRRFVRITGICSAVWVSAIFAVWHFLPTNPVGSQRHLLWTVAALFLVGPWFLGKVLQRLAAKRRISRQPEEPACLRPCAPLAS